MITIKSEHCHGCRQPLEEGESNHCEGCWMTHEEKITFMKDVVMFSKRAMEFNKANLDAVNHLMLHSGNLTEEKMKEVLWKIKRWDDAHDMEIESWMQKFFS